MTPYFTYPVFDPAGTIYTVPRPVMTPIDLSSLTATCSHRANVGERLNVGVPICEISFYYEHEH